MTKRHASVLAVAVVLAVGCGPSDRGEMQSMKAELAEARSELKALKDAQQTKKESSAPKVVQEGMLTELERLEVLRAKGALTQEEFAAAKKKLLGESQRPTQTARTMADLEKELRTLQALWSQSTINQDEYSAKKKQLVTSPIRVTDLKADLERVQAMWSYSVINNEESSQLKRALLEIDARKQ